jgi:signal transduction histidine kinase
MMARSLVRKVARRLWIGASSIRWRLALLYTLVLALTLVISNALIYKGLETFLLRAVDESLEQQAQEINGITYVQVIQRPVAGIGPGRMVLALPDVDVFASQAMFVQVIWPTGEVANRSTNTRGVEVPVDPDALAAALRREPVYVTQQIGDIHSRVLYAPLDPTPAMGDALFGVVQIGQSLREIELTLTWLRWIAVGSGLASLVVAFVGGWLLATAALRPIDRITRDARAIGNSRDFGRRVVDLPPHDEIGRLATTFNQMLSQLQVAYDDAEQSLESQRRFVADASHELRTPLATVRMNLDLLLRSGDEMTAEDREEALGDALAEIERLSRLVAHLLTLARADSGLTIEHKDRVRLDSLIGDVYRQARLMALPKEQSVYLEQAPPIEAYGNADYLKELMLILVDNAVAYTPVGGGIRLGVEVANRDAWLWVSDTGCGIEGEHLSRLFDRFYRADSTRTRAQDDQRDGTGLGLAIARWIAHEHDGTIEVSSQVGRGSRFAVRLPRLEIAPTDAEPRYASPVATTVG